MQAIELCIPRLRTYVAGDRYSVYGNGGLGEVDFDGAPLAGDVPFWPGTRSHTGHLNEGHLCWGHLDHAVPDGHLVGGHLEHGHLHPEAILRYRTPMYTLGHYVLAIRTYDAGGNTSSAPAASVTHTVNSSPRPASDLAKVGHEAGTDQITFSFMPSPDLTS